MSWSTTLSTTVLSLCVLLAYLFIYFFWLGLCFLPWLLYYEIELQKDLDYNMNGFIFTIITAFLTQPMNCLAYIMLILSHGNLTFLMEGENSKLKEIQLEEDEESLYPLPERISIFIPSSASSNKDDTTINIDETEEKSTISLENCRYISTEFCNLTTAWSPFFLWGFLCEIIILINAGFVIARATQKTQAFELHETIFIIFLMINSLIAVSIYSYIGERTYEVLQKFVLELR
jgi:hypothetical protein